MAINLGLDDDTPEAGTPEAKAREADPIARYLDETVDGPKDDAAPKTDANGNPITDQASTTDKSGGAGNDQNNNGQQKPDKKGKKDEGQTGTTNTGDLTLPDGTVIKAGAERRLHETLQLTNSQLSMRTNELNQANQSRERLQQELNTLKNTVSSVNGVEPEQLSIGVKLVKDLTRDPIGTLRNLLTEAVAAGHTIEGIGQGIDVAGIRAAIEQQYAPIVQQFQEQQNASTGEQDAIREVNQFYTQFPDAQLHDDVIAAIIERNPQTSLSDAYFQLKQSVIQRGLDWTKPLAPQMQSSEQQQQNQNNNGNVAPTAAPMPNGRGPANGTGVVVADHTTVAHEDTSFGDIVKDAMREAGLNIK